MARRRMFSLDIVDSDQFTDLPPMARLLYYELGVRADDDGFVGNPRKITRFAECSEEDIKILEDNGFIYMFDSGVLAIRHWTVNNQLRNDRYHGTYYVEEKKKLCKNMDNKTDYFIDDGVSNGIPLVDLDKLREEEINKEEMRKGKNNLKEKKEEKKNTVKDSEIDAEIKKQFDVLWNKYPRKVGKAEALKYYNEAIEDGHSFDIINQGLDKYIRYIEINGTEKEFIKKGSSWFNGYCWEDEYYDDIFNF